MYHAVVRDALNDGFCEYVEHLAKTSGDLSDGTLTGEGVNTDKRRSKIAWLTDVGLRNDLFDIVQRVNAVHFGFDIWNLADLQYTTYDAKDEGHYDWHTDDDVATGPNRVSARKLSLTIQLSDPSDYDGGDFQFYYDRELPEDIKNKGTILVFPSSHMHRVTPVTRGVRKSLVTWFEGPLWR